MRSRFLDVLGLLFRRRCPHCHGCGGCGDGDGIRSRRDYHESGLFAVCAVCVMCDYEFPLELVSHVDVVPLVAPVRLAQLVDAVCVCVCGIRLNTMEYDARVRSGVQTNKQSARHFNTGNSAYL
jgi:hypothetical protein